MTRIDEAQISILGSSFRQATSCNLKTYLAKYTDLNLIDFLSLVASLFLYLFLFLISALSQFPAIFRVTAPLSLAPLVVLAPGVSRTQCVSQFGRSFWFIIEQVLQSLRSCTVVTERRPLLRIFGGFKWSSSKRSFANLRVG